MRLGCLFALVIFTRPNEGYVCGTYGTTQQMAFLRRGVLTEPSCVRGTDRAFALRVLDAGE